MDGMILSGQRRVELTEISRHAVMAASGFHRLGIREGGAVALLLRNDVAFFEASMAAAILGAYAVPINWHFKADEAGYVLGDCGARILVAHADLLPLLGGALPPDIHVLVVPVPPEIRAAYGIAHEACRIPAGRTDWNEWLAAQTPWTAAPAAQRGSMIYTSGTTGRPKGVRRQPMDARALATRAAIFDQVFGIAPGREMRAALTGPLYHSAPNGYGLGVVQAGGSMLLLPRFDPEELLAAIEQYRLSHMHMVPTMFVRLLQLPDAVKRRYDLCSLRHVIHGAAPCATETKRAMLDWWGPVINEYYGSTEASISTYLTSTEALAKLGTVGRPLRCVTIRVYDEQGRQVPPGTVGEIYVRLEGYSDFTYHGQDAMRREIERDGLISVGDVGYLDADGYLFLCDRKRDMVISGGVNIYPAEIEAVLIGMPGVRDCALFGIPHAEFGETLCACIQLKPGAQLDARSVRAYLKPRIANYKIPSVVEFHDELPREDSGKIFKRRLRDPYWQGTGRRI